MLARRFTFFDLFAGIGGFRLAFEKPGGKCRFFCEWDKYWRKTYEAWFGEVRHGDDRELNLGDIPGYDLLAAGFPCQPFSLAGISKKNSLGREHGFRDDTRGTLFSRLAEISGKKRPTALLPEKLKNLHSHDKGKTWRAIRATLEELDYWPFPGVKTILDLSPDPKYTLIPKLWQCLQNYAEKYKAQGNGFGFGIADREGSCHTLSARCHNDGSEIPIAEDDDETPRGLTARECSGLMGFDGRPIVVFGTQACRQVGNSVVPGTIEAFGKELAAFL